MAAPKSMTVDEMREYLGSHGISYSLAQKVTNQVRKCYPRLGRALRDSADNRADLELIELIHHVQQGRFPPAQQD